MAVRFDIITIFPGMFSSVVSESIVGRAVTSGLVEINRVDLRDFTEDKHRSVDDRPYGGGPGMVFKPEPVFDAVENVLGEVGSSAEPGIRKIILTPQGRRLDQPLMRERSGESRIVLLCGQYAALRKLRLEITCSPVGSCRPWSLSMELYGCCPAPWGIRSHRSRSPLKMEYWIFRNTLVRLSTGG